MIKLVSTDGIETMFLIKENIFPQNRNIFIFKEFFVFQFAFYVKAKGINSTGNFHPIKMNGIERTEFSRIVEFNKLFNKMFCIFHNKVFVEISFSIFFYLC